jgi:hypothetical protein
VTKLNFIPFADTWSSRAACPPFGAQRRREGVAFDVLVDFGDLNASVGQRHRLRVDLRAADDPGFLGSRAQRQRFGQAGGALGAGLPQRLARDDDVARPGSGRNFGGSESQVLRPMMTGAPVRQVA